MTTHLHLLPRLKIPEGEYPFLHTSSCVVLNEAQVQLHFLLDLRFSWRAMKIQVHFFRVVTPCSVVVGYQRFRGPEDGGSTTLHGVTTQKTLT